MKTQKTLAALLLCAFLGGAAPLMGEVRFELGFGWTLVGPALNATYVNQYIPSLNPPDRYISSSASQTLRIKGKTMYGMNGFFNLFFTENFGLQILADYHRPGLGGANTPYDVSMSFTAFEPETYQNSIDWPDTEGNLTETTFSLNALARFRIARDLYFSLSGGPSVFHYEGKGGKIGYTFFNLEQVGDEYQLSGGTYQMVYRFGPQTKYGLNIGVEAAYEAFRSVILAFDVRWFGCASSDLPLHLVEDEIITIPLDEIEEAIGLGSIRVNPSYFRVGLAIRFIF
jgi:hypothetical protein